MATDLLQQGIQAARLGQKAQAINLLSKAVQESPNSAQAWYNLGTLLEDAQKAGYCLERAFHLDPSLRLEYLSSKSPAPASPPAPAPAPLSAKTPKPVPAEPSTLKPSLSTTLKTAPLRSNFSDNISDLRQSAAPHPFSPVKVEHPESAVVPGAPDLSDLRNLTPARAAAIPFTPVSMQPPAPGAGQAEQTRSDAPDLSDLRNMGGKAASPKKKSKTPERTAPTDGTVPKKRGADQWIKIAIGVMALVVVCVISVGIFLFTRGMTPGAGQPAAAAAVTPQQTELATIETPGPPTPSSTPSPSPTPSSTPTLDPTRVYQSLGMQVTAAYNLIPQNQFSACIQSYDQLLAKMPNWPIGLHNRAMCEHWYANSYFNNDFPVYHKYMKSAIEDLDRAIELNPMYANAYVERGYVYSGLADAEVLTDGNVDSRNKLYSIGLENLRAGVALNSNDEQSKESIPLTLINMNRCQEGVDEAKRLLSDNPSVDATTIYLKNAMALGYYCLGDNERALEIVENNLEISASCDGYTVQTKILISMGNKEKALNVINRCIQGSPGYGGYRYFLRALLNYDLAEKNQVDEDLAIGASYTAFHGGLFAYLTGLRLLDNGDSEEAKRELQYAYETWLPEEGPWVKKRILESMNTLNIPRQTLPASDSFSGYNATPLSPQYLTPGAVELPTQPVSVQTPAPAPVFTPTPDLSTDTSPLPVGYEDAILVDFDEGTGPLDLAPGDYPLFHFRPTYPIYVRIAKEYHLFMTPKKNGKPPIQVYFWTKEGGWRMIDAKWGDNVIEFPSFFISPVGDTYIAIRNWSQNQTVHIDNAGLQVKVELVDGDILTYGQNTSPAQQVGGTPTQPELILPTAQSTEVFIPTQTPVESEPPFNGPTG